MREPLRDKERLEHMLAAADRVIRYTSDKTYKDLAADDMMYYAVVKNIEIIGEAANMLTSLFKETHPEVEWRPISNMRNFLVHEYFQVDNDTVWAVIHGDIVELKKHILKYLAETDWEQWDNK